MYGVFAFEIEVLGIADNLQIGFTLWECYDRFFPGEGKEVLNMCNLRLEEKDERFKRGFATALKEMKEAYESEGQSSLPSLMNHLARDYANRDKP